MSSDNLDFNGQGGLGYSRMKDRFAGNHSGETMKERYSNGPTKGNASSNPEGHPKSIATAAQGGKINGHTKVLKPHNPDKINNHRTVNKGNE
jgi:hypothetical protein